MIYVYATSPKDYWAGWQKPESAFEPDPPAKVAQPEDEFEDDELFEDKRYISEFNAKWQWVQEIAVGVGWEGDIVAGPFISMLPDCDYCPSRFVIAWKQSNNGMTFYASPMPLPWLEEGCWFQTTASNKAD